MASPIVAQVLPAIVALVMLGLGLDLTVGDFTRVLRDPRAVLVTLACQVVVLPALCFGLVLLLRLPPALALGMMLLVASPGGAIASLFSHLAGGDVALNVSATAINALLALITMPVVTAISLAAFRPAGTAAVVVPPDRLLTLVAVVLLPVVLGMTVRWRRASLAARLHRPVRVAAVVAVFLAIVAAVGQQLDGFAQGLVGAGVAVTALSLLSLALGYGIPRLLRVGHRQAVASAMEVGIHNAVLAITVAVSVLDDPAAAVAPAMYGALMFGPAGLLAWVLARRGRRHDEPDHADHEWAEPGSPAPPGRRRARPS